MDWVIFHKETTESTNLDAREGRPGQVFTADFQTAGRGRLDHKWLSAPGENLMMSAVLDVADIPPDQVATLPLAVGLAVLRGLSSFIPSIPPTIPQSNNQINQTNQTISLKWPNDILVAGRKLSGILCERHGDVVIAGVGVNVRQRTFAPDIAARATSLALLGAAADTAAVRDAVLSALGAVYAAWRADGFAAIYPDIVAHDYLRGKFLGIIQTDDDHAPLKGVCGGVQPDGSLKVGDTCVYAGEAHVIGV